MPENFELIPAGEPSELDKLKDAVDNWGYDNVMEFVEWLGYNGIFLYRHSEDGGINSVDGYKVVDEFYELDQDKIEKERRELLDSILQL